MMKLTNLILGGLLLVIFALIAYIIFSAPIEEVQPFDDTLLRKEIAKRDSAAGYWQDRAIHWQEQADAYELKVDSLEALKPNIHDNHDDQINFNSTATATQLDSVIRANW